MATQSLRLEDLSSKVGFKLVVLTVDIPGEKVNTLGAGVMAELDGVLSTLSEKGARGEIDALILKSGKSGFIAGADIKAIQNLKSATEIEALAQRLQGYFNRWEDLPFPTIAAIQGAALGGGCEWALACTAMVLAQDPSTRIGQPEVLLGLLPGAGGTVRMPQRVGLVQSLDLILSGKALSAEKAFKLGLCDAAILPEDFWNSTVQWVRAQLPRLVQKVKQGSALRLGRAPKINRWLEGNPLGRGVIFSQARKGVWQKTKGHYPAALEILKVLEGHGIGAGSHVRGKAREKAMAREAAAFGRLAASEVSKNLIQIFFLTEGIKKATGLLPGQTVASMKPVTSAAVLGAGVMGGGIAQLFADKGIVTRMKDITPEALGIGLQSAAQLFKKQVKRRKLNPREYLQKMNLIAPVLDFSGFGKVDAVVEAVIEKMEVKKKVLAELEGVVSADCVIATNTSSLSVSEMQTVLKNPGRFVGMHFFNPVHKMPLIEVIRGSKTDDRAVATIFALSKQIGKMPIVVKDAPGFLVNRLLVPYMNEAMMLVAEGVPIDEVDRVLVDFGMPMGPLELIDEVGVDVGEKVLHILHAAFGDRMLPCPIAEKVVKTGRLGKKSSKGMYLYEGSGDRKTKKLDPEIYSIMGVRPQPRSKSDEDILDRCLLPMINEAARCLEEKIVETAADCDLGMIMGTGFPPFRGGLLRYADSRGVAEISKRLQGFAESVGIRYAPSEALLARSKTQKTFY